MSYTLGNAPTYRAEAPYTFFVPHDRELAALSVGDIVKLIFEYDAQVKNGPPSECGCRLILSMANV